MSTRQPGNRMSPILLELSKYDHYCSEKHNFCLTNLIILLIYQYHKKSGLYTSAFDTPSHSILSIPLLFSPLFSLPMHSLCFSELQLQYIFVPYVPPCSSSSFSSPFTFLPSFSFSHPFFSYYFSLHPFALTFLTDVTFNEMSLAEPTVVVFLHRWLWPA